MGKELTWIEINKENIKNNIEVIHRAVGPDIILSPAIKANAYGHGIVAYAKELIKNGVKWLSVNSVFEAQALRSAGIEDSILIIGFVQSENLAEVINLDARLVVYNKESAEKLSQLAEANKRKVKVHVKIDTGMSRQGILPKDAKNFLKFISGLPGLELEGMSTHFAKSDDLDDPDYFKKQLKRFKEVEKIAKDFDIKILHAANSAAALMYPEAHFNLVRPGISVYGLYPDRQVEKKCMEKDFILKPTLSLKTKVAQIKTLPKGTSISYGCTFTTEKETRVAILPIGYYDGLDRRLTNQGEVLIKGKRASILGRVCMNICIVNISQIEGVELEEEVVLIGKQGDEEITATEIAEKIGTINYEITTRLRESIPRYLV